MTATGALIKEQIIALFDEADALTGVKIRDRMVDDHRVNRANTTDALAELVIDHRLRRDGGTIAATYRRVID